MGYIMEEEDDGTYYLGGYLNSLTSLPLDVKKNFSKMSELDQRNNDISLEVEGMSEDYLRKVKERHLNPRRRKQEMERIQKMFTEAKDNSDNKVNLAIQTYELVDKHIRKLDADLAKFDTEMKEAGGRLSQTESEDDDDRSDDKKRSIKKKKKHEELAARKTDQKGEEQKKFIHQGADGGAPGGVVPIVDMPVDPNEPTYCLCQQVSYGEMIGCDNQDCPIEWFHFGCMALTTKPKGKWYCPKCAPMYKKLN